MLVVQLCSLAHFGRLASAAAMLVSEFEQVYAEVMSKAYRNL